MKSCGKNILLKREGTEQNERFNEALNPDVFKLNDFDLKEWMKFAYNFAHHLNYFEGENASTPVSNWQQFFKSYDEISDFITELEKGETITPHLALFVTFIKLLEIPQKQFNKLNKRHLDYYFQQVLQLPKHEATPDKVHVLFELAKNATSQLIQKGTMLNGTRDSQGKVLDYATTEDIVANQITVASLKSVYFDPENSKIKVAPVANSYDGKGGAFKKGEEKWWPFGYYESRENEQEAEYPELEDARIGVAFSGNVLRLLEGERSILLNILFTSKFTEDISYSDLIECLEIYCSGEKTWLGSFEPVEAFVNTMGHRTVSGAKANTKELNIAFKLGANDEAIVPYNEEALGEKFETNQAICRVLFKTGSKKSVKLYREIETKTLQNVRIQTTVKAYQNLKLSNDNGVINGTKPFYPFGVSPTVSSNFNVECPECFANNWINASIELKWKNVPTDLKKHYKAYRKSFLAELSPETFIAGMNNSANTNLIVSGDSYFKAKLLWKNKENWEGVDDDKDVNIFAPSGSERKMRIELNKPEDFSEMKAVRLSLKQSFLHEMYPRIYALAMSSTANNVLIPNEAYTPIAEQALLNYDAEARFQDASSFADKIEITHEYPFGQCKPDEPQGNRLLPQLNEGGELLIGLENAHPKEVVSLFVQVLEGSESTSAESFAEMDKVQWSVLCNNTWKRLESEDLIADDTDNFLKSGIVKISLPQDSSREHNLMPSNLIWLKASMSKKFNAVSKVLGIHTQAVLAKFQNNENSLEHLNTGLAAESIAKMQNRLAGVKKIIQPYNSQGGVPAETDAAYYRRISERLRHKNRALTMWDYEHLLLQKFPEIYKVKCLNHSGITSSNNKTTSNYLSPGSVLLVVIPDIINKNVFDLYKPSLSQGALNQFQEYLETRCSKLVKIRVVNPRYEELRISLKVKFYPQFDKTHYKLILNIDITKLLSPWAFNRKAAIRFGQSIYKSALISFIEKLHYVDYVSDVKMFQKNNNDSDEQEADLAEPSCPEAIIVSAKKHNINDIENNRC